MVQSLLGSLFLTFCTTLVLMRSHVQAKSYAHVQWKILMKSINASIARTEWWFLFYSTARGTLHDTHGIHTGQSIFSFLYYASFDAQPCASKRAMRMCNGRYLWSQDYASIARTEWWFLFYSTARGTLHDTHGIHVYYVNRRVTHGKPCDSWGSNTWSWNSLECNIMKVYGTILVCVI